MKRVQKKIELEMMQTSGGNQLLSVISVPTGNQHCGIGIGFRLSCRRRLTTFPVSSSRMGDVEDFPDFREAASPGPRVTFNIQDTVSE